MWRAELLARRLHAAEAVMFCPRCKAEYRVGFLTCSDCDIALVDQLPADSQPIYPPRGSEVDHSQLIAIRTYQTVVDADLAKTALDAVGIDSMVRSDTQGSYSPANAEY